MTRKEKIEALLDQFKTNNPNRNTLVFKMFLNQKTDEQLDELLQDQIEQMNNYAYSN